jgi:hypothetical protein
MFIHCALITNVVKMAGISKSIGLPESIDVSGEENYELMMADIPAWWCMCKQYTDSTTTLGKSRAVAFWRTLIADKEEWGTLHPKIARVLSSGCG